MRARTAQELQQARRRPLDLTIGAGELYALLGPNGAGKTTTLRMVAGLLKPTAGSIRVFGVDALADPIAAKQMIAWLPDEPMLYDRLRRWNTWSSSPASGASMPTTARARAEELLSCSGSGTSATSAARPSRAA